MDNSFYIYTIFLSIVLFAIIKLYDKKDLLKENDIVTYMVLLFMSGLISYFFTNQNIDISPASSSIINESIKTGIKPFS